jgi:hypothetical protein
MFSTLRKFFGKRAEEDAEHADTAVAEHPEARPLRPVRTANAGRGDAPGRPVRVELPARAPAPGDTISLPLRAVISRLPADLVARVRQTDVGEAEVFVPTRKVMAQLALGAVRISFGELRQASPPGTFSPENDRDRVLVELPLHEILLRVDPGLLARRAAQKHIEVPQEVTGPFGGQNKVTICTTPLKPVAPVRQAPAAHQPISRRSPGAPAQPAPPAPQVYPPMAPAVPVRPMTERLPSAPVFARNNFPARQPVAPVPPQEQVFKRAQPPVTPPPPPPMEEEAAVEAEEPAFQRAQPAPARPPSAPVYSPIASEEEPPPIQAIPFVDHTSIPAPAFTRPLSASLPMAPPPPVALPTPDEEPEPIRFNPSFAPEPVAPPPPPPAPPVQATPRETVFLTLSLAELSAAWPEAIQGEINELNLADASAALPQGMIEATLKRGKMVFLWKMVRTWIKPPLMGEYSSPNDAVALELPLKVVTPAFLASLRTVRTQKKISVDANIPNLFSGATGGDFNGTAPAPAPARAPEAPDTNYYVWRDKNEPAVEEAVVIKKGPSPGTSFLQRYATPNEIVSKAAAMNGVGGALIALPDGLLVASKIPGDMNADTLAAFLPQIFGRVSQCTRELRLGDLNNLNFTVGLIPWKIFRVGAIYFAAFGIAGQSLPTAQLAGIAAELDRKPK